MVAVDINLYRNDTGDAIHVFHAEGSHREAIEQIVNWLKLEVAPYWPYGALWFAPSWGCDPHIAAALYGIGRTYGMVDDNAHDWLPWAPK